MPSRVFRWASLLAGRAGYLPLPSLAKDTSSGSEACNCAGRVIRQRTFKVVAALLLLALIGTLWNSNSYVVEVQTPKPIDPLHPPLYDDYEALELGLPQHDPKLPYPEGANGRYFFPADHVWGLGFNNVLQEHIFLAHLAFLANRTFAFDPYTWHWDPKEPYSNFGGKIVPSRIPWHAFLKGPAIGDAFPPEYSSPRAVRKEFFRRICPQPEVLNSSVVGLRFQEDFPDAKAITNAWVEYLRTVDTPCLEIDGWSPHIYDVGVFMTSKVVKMYESLVQSPILMNLSWSDLVESTITANLHLLRPETSAASRLSSWLGHKGESDYPPKMLFPGLLTMHIRRGDYETHCYALEVLKAPMQGWYSLPGIPDQFSPPPGNTTEEQHKYFRDHCWPTIDQIVHKIHHVRTTKEGSGLDSVYIMTNGDREWVATLKEAIGELGGFRLITSSRDMIWSPESKYISQAVDMAIANQAQAFIGNGFSSMSSNVVLLRSKDGMPRGSNFMW